MNSLQRLFGILAAGALSIAVGALNACGATMMAQSDRFSFRHFDSLPQDKILPEAQEFVDEHFPPGSDVEHVLGVFAKAGAQCDKGKSREGEDYYLCYYSHGFLIQVEWKIAVYPEKIDAKKVRKVVVNRGLTGL